MEQTQIILLILLGLAIIYIMYQNSQREQFTLPSGLKKIQKQLNALNPL